MPTRNTSPNRVSRTTDHPRLKLNTWIPLKTKPSSQRLKLLIEAVICRRYAVSAPSETMITPLAVKSPTVALPSLVPIVYTEQNTDRNFPFSYPSSESFCIPVVISSRRPIKQPSQQFNKGIHNLNVNIQ